MFPVSVLTLEVSGYILDAACGCTSYRRMCFSVGAYVESIKQ